LSISFHYSTYISSAFSISFHYSTYFTYHFTIFFCIFQNLFTIQLGFHP
jgi:hypothetical protein